MLPFILLLCRSAIQQHSRLVELNSQGTHAVYYHEDNEPEDWDASTHKWRSHDSVPQGEDHCSSIEQEAPEGQIEQEAPEGQSTGTSPEPECWD